MTEEQNGSSNNKRLARYKEAETLKGDLRVGAGPLAQLFLGEDTPSARRAIYHQYEHGRLPAAFKLGSLIAVRRSSVLAALWAREINRLDARTVQLMELHLQLKELAAALSDRHGDQFELSKLDALLEATCTAINEIVEVQLPNRLLFVGRNEL